MARSRKFRKTLRRRRGTKRSVRRRSSSYKRRRYFRRTNSHSYILRRSVVSVLTVTQGTPTTGAFLINPGAFGNFTELQGLYDQYKIQWAKVTFRPKFPATLTTTPSVANYNGYFFSILDFDSPQSATFSRSDMQQYRSLHQTRLTSTHTRVYKPTAVENLSYLNYSNVTSSTLVKRGGWFDMAQPVDTYNLRVYIDGPVEMPTEDIQYDCDVVLKITCKNVR